jgi:outer membrane protein assembly factor BamE (lipoprotein component of BamABCDE complex)
MKPNRIHIATACFAVLITILSTGCRTNVTSGTPIQSEAMNSLDWGMPYQEVVAELGPPLLYLDGQRAVAYSWDTNRGYVMTRPFWRSMLNIIPAWRRDDDYDISDIHPFHHALCLEFDDQKRLKDWKCFEAPTPEALQREMAKWTASQLPITTAQAK